MVSDATVVETGECDLYAAAILDLHGKLPVGLLMDRRKIAEVKHDIYEYLLHNIITIFRNLHLQKTYEYVRSFCPNQRPHQSSGYPTPAEHYRL